MGVFGEAGVMGLMRWECWFPILTVPVATYLQIQTTQIYNLGVWRSDV